MTTASASASSVECTPSAADAGGGGDTNSTPACTAMTITRKKNDKNEIDKKSHEGGNTVSQDLVERKNPRLRHLRQRASGGGGGGMGEDGTGGSGSVPGAFASGGAGGEGDALMRELSPGTPGTPDRQSRVTQEVPSEVPIVAHMVKDDEEKNDERFEAMAQQLRRVQARVDGLASSVMCPGNQDELDGDNNISSDRNSQIGGGKESGDLPWFSRHKKGCVALIVVLVVVAVVAGGLTASAAQRDKDDGTTDDKSTNPDDDDDGGTDGLSISCPPDKKVYNDPGFSYATVTLGEANATDNSGEQNISIVRDVVSDQFPLGTTRVTFQADDGAGNFASCTVAVTVRVNCPWKMDTTNVTYNDKIILQNDYMNDRWLTGGRGTNANAVYTYDYSDDGDNDNDGERLHSYNFILRSAVGNGTRDYKDPRAGECVEYGDLVILQSNTLDNRWLTGGRGTDNEDTYTRNYIDGDYVEAYRFVARSTPGDGSRGYKDPDTGRCIEYGDRILLQVNNLDYRWLTGSRGGGNAEVHTRNQLDGGYEQNTKARSYMFYVRGENDPGNGRRCE